MTCADTISDVGELAGADEIGDMLGVSRQRVYQLTSRTDFPKPIEVLRMGRIWRTEDVRQWARDHNRDIADTGDTDVEQQ